MDVNRDVDERGNPVFIVSDQEKSTAHYIVKKTNDGHALYGVELKDGGKVPEVLSGRYTRTENAIKAVEAYLRNMKPTKVAKRNINTQRREAQKNAQKLQSDNEEHVQQGVAD